MKLTPQISVNMGRQSSTRKNDPAAAPSAADLEALGLKAVMFQETTETIAKVVITAYAAKKLIDTVCQIAVIAAEAKLK